MAEVRIAGDVLVRDVVEKWTRVIGASSTLVRECPIVRLLHAGLAGETEVLGGRCGIPLE